MSPPTNGIQARAAATLEGKPVEFVVTVSARGGVLGGGIGFGGMGSGDGPGVGEEGVGSRGSAMRTLT